MNGAHPEEEGAEHRNDAIERPCPACRNPISQEKLFSHTAFEPSDAEMRAAKVEEDDAVPILDGEPRVGRVLRRRRSCSLSIHSEYDDEDDLDDFIVEDGHEDSDDDDDFNGRRERKAEKKRRHKAKGKARAIILSDDEDDDDVICGAKPDYDFVPAPGAGPTEIRMLPKFVPSAKMKVRFHI